MHKTKRYLMCGVHENVLIYVMFEVLHLRFSLGLYVFVLLRRIPRDEDDDV